MANLANSATSSSSSTTIHDRDQSPVDAAHLNAKSKPNPARRASGLWQTQKEDVEDDDEGTSSSAGKAERGGGKGGERGREARLGSSTDSEDKQSEVKEQHQQQREKDREEKPAAFPVHLRHVSDGSTCEDDDEAERGSVMMVFDRVTPYLFDEAQKVVFGLLENDAFGRYLQGPLYAEYLSTIQAGKEGAMLPLPPCSAQSACP